MTKRPRLFAALFVLLFAVALTDQASALYDPGVGRFCSRDPIEYEGSLWGLYEYVKGKVLIDYDPSGTGPPLAVAALAVAVVACFTPFYHAGLGIPDENARHCWTACQASAACGAGLTQLMGFGFEVATGAIDTAVHGNTDIKNHLLDLANNARGSYCAGLANLPTIGIALGWVQWCVGRGCAKCCGV